MIEAIGASYYRGSAAVLQQVTFALEPGKLYGIIGPNGGGKSTLLKLLSGIERPAAGQVLLEGKPVADYPRKGLARLLAVLQQEGLPQAAFTVKETVAMGRFPFQNWLGDETENSQPLIEQIMKQMNLWELRDRPLNHISGGERQRAALAQIMVQQPSIVLLDEPTTYLDIGFQAHLMDMIASWQRERGITAVAVMHDLNLASMYCDEILVLHKGEIAASGTPGQVLTRQLIRDVYGAEASLVAHPDSGRPQFLLQSGAWSSQ